MQEQNIQNSFCLITAEEVNILLNKMASYLKCQPPLLTAGLCKVAYELYRLDKITAKDFLYMKSILLSKKFFYNHQALYRQG